MAVARAGRDLHAPLIEQGDDVIQLIGSLFDSIEGHGLWRIEGDHETFRACHEFLDGAQGIADPWRCAGAGEEHAGECGDLEGKGIAIHAHGTCHAVDALGNETPVFVVDHEAREHRRRQARGSGIEKCQPGSGKGDIERSHALGTKCERAFGFKVAHVRSHFARERGAPGAIGSGHARSRAADGRRGVEIMDFDGFGRDGFDNAMFAVTTALEA